MIEPNTHAKANPQPTKRMAELVAQIDRTKDDARSYRKVQDALGLDRDAPLSDVLETIEVMIEALYRLESLDR